jgi:hypothetical protein
MRNIKYCNWSIVVTFNLSPFLYTGHKITSFHCVGSFSLSHIFRINLYGFCFKVLPPFFINSGGILSVSAAVLDCS